MSWFNSIPEEWQWVVFGIFLGLCVTGLWLFGLLFDLLFYEEAAPRGAGLGDPNSWRPILRGKR